jgi:hypothetical protein
MVGPNGAGYAKLIPIIRRVENGYDPRVVAKLSIIFSHGIDLISPGAT